MPALNNIGRIHLEKQDFDKAEEYFFKSLDIRKRLNLINKEIDSNNNLCKLYQSMNQNKKAFYYAQLSLKLLKKNQDINSEIDVYSMMYLFYAEKNQYKKALEYLEMYNQSKQRFLNNENLRNMEKIKSKYNSELMQIEIREKTEKVKLNSVINIAIRTNERISEPIEEIKHEIHELLKSFDDHDKYTKYIEKIEKSIIRIEEMQRRFLSTTTVHYKHYMDNTKMVDIEEKPTISKK